MDNKDREVFSPEDFFDPNFGSDSADNKDHVPYYPPAVKDDLYFDGSLFPSDMCLIEPENSEEELFEYQVSEYEKDEYEYTQEKGKVFPTSTIILGSLVKQAVSVREFESADVHFKMLASMPMETFSFDVLLVYIRYLMFDPVNNEHSIRKAVERLKTHFPMYEHGTYFEAILEKRLGNVCKSHEIARQFITSTTVSVPLTSEFLAFEMLRLGAYVDTVRYADLALSFADGVERVRTQELLFASCLARDSLLMGKFIRGEEVPVKLVDAVLDAYEETQKTDRDRGRVRAAERRIHVLKDLRRRLV